MPALARRLEDAGFDGIHVPETIHDSFAVALLAAEHTSRLTIRTAVTLAFVRSPTLVAYAAWDVQALSGGRFELGLGTQVRQNIEGRYGMPWSAPVRRMEDYLGAVQAAFHSFSTGAPLRHEGEHYRLTRLQPYFDPGPLDVGAPPVLLGGVSPAMCRLAGRAAAGLITHSTGSDPDQLRSVARPSLAEGAGVAGRPVPPLYAAAAVATGADPAAVRAERERHRRLMAFLYSTPAYRGTLDRLGRPDVLDRLAALVREDRWDLLTDVLDDDLLDALLVSGTYDELPELLLERYRGLADGLVLTAPADPGGDPALRTLIAALRAAD